MRDYLPHIYNGYGKSSHSPQCENAFVDQTSFSTTVVLGSTLLDSLTSS